MNLWPFRRTQKPQDGRKPKNATSDDQFHKYVSDITDMRQQRNSLMQSVILKKPGAAEELERTDRTIEIAQRTLLELEAKRDKA
jgi:hypothetical protein